MAIIGDDSDNNLVGTTGDDTLQGLGGNDTLDGDSGNDWIDGGYGADSMSGGLGNDTYFVDDYDDNVVEYADGGTDWIVSSIDVWVLPDEVENLAITGIVYDGEGNMLDNHIIGNAAGNILDGRAGNDTLDGGAGDDIVIGGAGDDYIIGGLGVDILRGGLGNDTLVVDDAADEASELANAGTDTVISTVSYTLGANLENLNINGTASITGTGNTLANLRQRRRQQPRRRRRQRHHQRRGR